MNNDDGVIFSHIKDDHVHMVDISEKSEVFRTATAIGTIRLHKKTVDAIRAERVAKGNVLATARIAAVLGVKRTAELIPMCHQIQITGIDVDFDLSKTGVTATVSVGSTGKTGVEMEALTGVSVALLTVWDMVKSAEKDETGNYPYTLIGGIKIIEKIKKSP